MAHYAGPRIGQVGEKSAYPEARAAALVECGTHPGFAAEAGPPAGHETELAQRLFTELRPDMLVLADRGFHGFDLWRAATATGADLLWRVKIDAVLPVRARVIPRSQVRSRPMTGRG
ncbi:hypothetical protein ACWGQ5_21135 [Streptomyces sp. NPDC055722]